MPYQLRAARPVLACAVAALFLAPVPAAVHAQPAGDFVPVTDAMLEDPAPADWLSWRRTPDRWGFSPLDQIDRENVGALQMVWSRGLTTGSQEGTPLAYDGVLYMPNPGDVIQAIDAVTGDLRWEYRRDSPDDVEEYVGGLTTNRNIAIHGRYIIDTSVDNHVFALDAATGRLAWETAILDYRTNPARHSSGPIIAGGRVVSGRSCMPRGGPDACVITAHDAATGAEVWRRRTIPAPGEPGDETWGGIPFEERVHVGSWMAPSYDPALNLVYVGTSVTSPAPKFLLGGVENQHLYHNSTLALDGDTGEILGLRSAVPGAPWRLEMRCEAPEAAQGVNRGRDEAADRPWRLRGVPTPVSCRIRKPRLNPQACTRRRSRMLVSPRRYTPAQPPGFLA